MKTVVTTVLFLGLCGCGSDFRSSAPTLWTDGIMLEQKKVTVDDQHAKVIMQASGDTANPVDFEVVRGNDPDTRPDHLGTVVKPFRNKVGGWFSRLSSAVSKHFPQLEIQADPGQILQVGGSSTISSHVPAPGYRTLYNEDYVFNPSKNKFEKKVTANPTVSSYYACGPITSTFIPEKQKVYLAEFVFVDRGEGCELQVYDITQPELRVPVVAIKGAQPSSRRSYHSP
ncbi:hypothetical protein C1Y08_21275 [Pseudomonas sp. FW306-02-F02-AA]|uniref:Lipoprotein n=1 Tax=Pseudomonas fluorescens TaxID=294 RepID=A0A0N9W663_PSEFL|nr:MULTISPECIES: hypothetical protein [Pseudomonas]ALH99710.1 hypothetical protein AO353_01125 [Pseudomonas fluorescens]PMZ02865.1 hypothetical protein C1Y07_17375 [Pseudomonas sp. FW306-02-F02-AB]PMZ08471.1 hypothetical protein C1Y06_18825 [Pseudomonas sp. FW306-02-H06C]PMZ13881.1 hypothetical protein C1Y08_21275 [Pseudomonas sp. FW306-02-F02-AA]PMZ20561.1 hypothetical protein C1Y09_17825 [Pseudomonas sp. FW306-02-F08-AA]